MARSIFTGVVLTVLFSLITNNLAAQSDAAFPVQTLRGYVTDESGTKPLSDVLVQLNTLDTTLISISDSSGTFAFTGVPVGRVNLSFRLLGYRSLRMDGVLVEGARETVVECRMEPQVTDLETVEIVDAETVIIYPIMYVNSEEVRRYPANWFDPGRYATQLPGFQNDNDQGNSLSVRGTSPAFFRWRLEGIEIVNPNHTANAGTFGDRATVGAGGINMLSNEAMGGAMAFRASDLPMRFDNTLSGMLDMHYRRGNSEKRETMLRVGLIGLEAATEGPLSANSDASYLVHYRYSFTGLLSALGVDFGDEDIRFQDLSFNLDFPDTKVGRFRFFGVGGTSGNAFVGSEGLEELEDEKQLQEINFSSRTGILGLSHSVAISDQTVWHNRIGFSATESDREAFDRFDNAPISISDRDSLQEQKLFISSQFVFASRDNNDLIQVGINFLNQSTITGSQFVRQRDTLTTYDLVSRVNRQAQLFRLYGDWEKTFNRWTFALGLNASWYPAAEEIHPGVRLSGQYKWVLRKMRVKAGYQSIAQLPPAVSAAVFGEDTGSKPAVIMPLMKTEGLFVDYHWQFNNSLQLYAGLYHNIYYNLPQSLDPNIGFSAFNQLEQFRLYNIGINDEGEGRTYGLELSARRQLDKSWFYLVTGSLYRSFYTNAFGIEFPSQFDRKYSLSATAGREWTLAASEGRSTIVGASVRGILGGGLRVAPIDEAESATLGFTVFDYAAGYVDQLPPYFRIDLQANISWNRTGFTQQLTLDLQNTTNQQNLAFYYYDNVAGAVAERYQVGLVPILSYRVTF